MSTATGSRFLAALTLCAFVAGAWVVHRALGVRGDCVHSRILAFVRWRDPRGGMARVENCGFASRLSVSPGARGVTFEQAGDLRKLEAASADVPLFSAGGSGEPELSLELVSGREFTPVRGALRLGRGWLGDPAGLRRALTLAYARTAHWRTFDSEFQLETEIDLWRLIHGAGDWDRLRDVRFADGAADFATYCRTPFRSLAHGPACAFGGATAEVAAADVAARAWGFRLGLVAGLYRAFGHLGLGQKLAVIERLRRGPRWPIPAAPPPAGLAKWFSAALDQNAAALGIGIAASARARDELQIEDPLSWDLTVDLTRTPAWREIAGQFTAWSRLRPRERTLLLTPAGQIALPTGWPVHWDLDDLRSLKHLLIACPFPPAGRGPRMVRATQTFAQRGCGKLGESFWD